MKFGITVRQLRDRAQYWHVTPAEREAHYPCDDYAESDWMSIMRGIDVNASPPVVFRWICQLTVAPYSYDWIDHRGRRSPRTLTPGADQLRIGQPLMIGRITDFAVDDHITGIADPNAAKRFGPVAMSYLVRPQPEDRPGSRLLSRIRLGGDTPLLRIAHEALLWGDLVMMRKQFLNLKANAEASSRQGSISDDC